MTFKLTPLHIALLIAGLIPLAVAAQDVTLPILDDTHIAATNADTLITVNASTKARLNVDTSTLPGSKEAIQTSNPAYGEKNATVASQKTMDLKGSTDITGAKDSQDAIPVSHVAGDMQYWNGSAWINISPGLPNATLKNCKGVPTWSSGCVFAIGDTGPAGGKVFYLTDTNGLHGLEASPADQSDAIKWSCYGTSVGVTATTFGTGKANTTAINTICGTETAANIAASYSLNGFTDWYLPSKDELNLLYNQKTVVGGFANSLYWSSTENTNNLAWYQYYVNGHQNFDYKYITLAVRAIRDF